MGVDGQLDALAALPPSHFTADWVGPRAGLNGCGKSRLLRDSIPKPSSPYRNRYTD